MRYPVLMLLFITLLACRKNQLGGKSVIEGRVAHHGKAIANAMVYVKLNAKEFPGADSSKYEGKFRANPDGYFRITCYQGDYYLYATGIDLQAQPLYVHGGIPVHIRKNETVESDIAVSEI